MTLYELYLNTNESKIEGVTVNDGEVEGNYESVFDAMAYHGEDREIDTSHSELDPDENGNIEIALLEPVRAYAGCC